ncbi:MAG: hypothetical protein NTX71_00145 [Candidatus Aureabacteria bacterium]|nr:hypothetical protein [Candidatus Auribacterota bacterium]
MYRKVKPGFVAGVVSIVFFIMAAALFGAPKGAAKRMSDVVVSKGSEAPGLLGILLERIGGYAMKGGKLEVVPFQIDERDKNGDLVYTKYEGGTTAKLDGKLDGKDDIVFLYQDAGERMKGEALPAGATGGAEIKVADPLGGPDAFFYLFTFEGKAPRSEVDYVKYDPKKDWVTSIYYTVGFPYRKAIQVPSYFSQSAAAGGNGKNIYDLYKLLLKIDLKLIGKEKWSQNDFISVPVGYVEGPVRVSRRVTSALRLAGPIHSATLYSDSSYYPYYCSFPSRIQIPFHLQSIAHSVSMRISDDLSGNAKGMTWYNERNKGGLEITGKPSEEAEKLDRGEYRWKIANGPQGTLMTVTLFDPGMGMIKKGLYYHDDESKPDEPCQFIGQIANSGFELTNIESLPKGNYNFTVYVFCPVNYRKGDEEIYLDSITHPLTVSANSIPVKPDKP